MKRLLTLVFISFLLSGCGLHVEVVKRYHRSGYTVDVYNSRNRVAKHESTTNVVNRKSIAIPPLNQRNVALPPDDNKHEIVNTIISTKPFATPQRLLQAVETFAIDSPRRDSPLEQGNEETIIDHPVPLITLFLSAAGLIALYLLGASSGIFPSSGTIALLLIGLVLGSLSFMLFKKWRFKNAQPKGSAGYHAMDLLNVLLLSVLWSVLIGLLFLILIIVLLAAIFRNW